jgi:hypothetical protein
MGDNSDWDSGPAESRVLHFFPGWGELVWRVNGRTVLKGNAWGGTDPEPGKIYDTMPPRKTTPGNYVIHGSGPYVTQTWKASRIAWGTPLRLSVEGTDLLYATGSHPRWASALKKTELSLEWVKRTYQGLYGNSKLYDPDNDGIPDQWVFNDFGPIAIRYFRDLNRNKKLDGGEKLSGEMFHTTPAEEASKVRGLPYDLTSSHGCMHITPWDRDRFMRAGAFARGVDLVIHLYSESMPAEWR